MAAFRQLVDIDLQAKEIRWEVFGTPEYSIGTPGPTDFITLIAEIRPADQAFAERPQSEMTWIAPEAARPWLAPNFRSMFEKHRNTSVNLSKLFNCRALQGRLKETGKPVNGVICNESEVSVIYLTLSDFSAS